VKSESIEERIANHLRPAERPDFFDELWERTEADASRRAKRWRTASVALAVVALAAITSTAVVAARRASTTVGGPRVVDRTVECGAKIGGVPGLNLFARVNEPPLRAVPQPGLVGVDAGNTASPQALFAGAGRLLWVWSPTAHKYSYIKSGYEFDRTMCRPTSRLALVSSRLPALGTFSNAGHADLNATCPTASGSVVTVRMRVRLARPGAPTSAKVAVAVGRHRHPVAFVDWTPTRFKAFLADGCFTG
jgi:hypothetical protein